MNRIPTRLKTGETLVEAAARLGLDKSTLYKRYKAGKDPLIPFRQVAARRPCSVLGVEYPSVKAAADAINIPYSTLKNIMQGVHHQTYRGYGRAHTKLNGRNAYYLDEGPVPSWTPNLHPNRLACEVLGNDYPSVDAAAADLGVGSSTLRNILRGKFKKTRRKFGPFNEHLTAENCFYLKDYNEND